MNFNKNIYWNTKDINGIANKWSWAFDIFFYDSNENSNNTLFEKYRKLISNRVYSIGSMPVKKMNVVNSYQGGIRMTHPGRVYYDGDLEIEFYEDMAFSITQIFYRLLNSRFANITIMDEDYPYKDSTLEIDKIYIRFFDSSNYGLFNTFIFYNCWVKGFEYLNNLETKNEEEPLKCKATIKYNYYTIT